MALALVAALGAAFVRGLAGFGMAILLVPVLGLAIPPAEAVVVTRHGNRFFRRGTELARRHARLVLVPSEATAAECREAGFDPDRLRIVPWGVDPQPVAPGDVEGVRRRFGLQLPYVLFVGTVEPRKNLGGVIGAVAGLAGRDLDLVRSSSLPEYTSGF